MAHGAMWMSLLRICVQGISLVSTVILARLLVPADFGLIAMATSIIAFLQLATAFSFDIPLIQKQDSDRNYFDSAWTLNVCFYGVLTALLLLLAEPAAAFYQESRLVPVIYVLAVGFFIQGFDNIGVVYFRKELDFKKEFVLMLSKKFVGFAVTIPLAFFLRSYWALITGMVVGNAVGVALSYMLHPFRPRFSLGSASELMHFSKWLMINNAINFLRNRSPDFIIGRISGTSALGLFTVAYQFATLPTSELVAPINRAVFPGYSKLAGKLADLRKSYLDVLSITAVVALPAGLGMAVVATPLVDVVLGERWSSAAPIIGVLAIYASLNALQTNTGSVFNAIGKPHIITVVGLSNTFLLIAAAIPLAINYGPLGVTAAYLGSNLAIAPLTFYFVCRETRLPCRELLTVIWAPLACSLIMYVTVKVFAIKLEASSSIGSALLLAALVALGIFVYSSLMLAVWLLRGRPTTAEYRLAMLIMEKVRPLRFSQS